MKPVAMLAAAFLVALSGGCTRTYISTGDPGFPSPDGDTRLTLTAHGAYGRSYLKKTKKLLDVHILRGASTNEQRLFEHSYRFVGADLWGVANWTSTGLVSLVVYDYPEGVYHGEAQTKSIPSNQIATLRFELDKLTGRFEQKP